ncbi:MAG: hypothetical protein ACFFEM_12350, partial [Candidatus Thorarchaeota archaeon]
APVSAVQTNIIIEEYNQAWRSGANNHTYIYVEPDPLSFISHSYMHANEDLDYTQYRYNSGGWTSPGGSVSEGTNAPFDWSVFNSHPNGPFANDARLPKFYDFEAADGSEFVVNTTLETRTYSLAFGQHTSVIADAGSLYVGTLGISGQEFVHLTIDSKQDAVSWTVYVYDPEGRPLGSYIGFEGDIWTIPFKPSIAGTYYVLLTASPSSGTFALFDFLPVAVSATPIALGDVVTGELKTGEIVIDPETGSFVQEEKAPAAFTYRVDSPTDVASVTYAFNYGGLFDTQPEYIMFTSGAFVYGTDGGSRYGYSVGSPSTGEYFYRGGPYYVTVIGGDNTEYTLYNRVNSYGDLPVNHEFQFENYMGATTSHAYRLDIDEPSILRMNSTAAGGDLTVYLVGVYDDGFRVSRTISFGANMQSSSDYYLPVGEYLVEMVIDAGVNEWAEFNIGPIVSETRTNIVDVGGFFFDAETFHMYNLTLFLNNEDNVTVDLEVTLYDAVGWELYSVGMTLANRWDGSQIVPHPSIWDNDTLSYAYQAWYEGQAFLSICAYSVDNNTQGATNGYTDYSVDLTLQWMNMDDQYYAGIESLDVSAGSASTNITLLTPATPSEWWGVRLNATPGVWYNVSVMTGGLNDIGNGIFSLYAGSGHWTGSGDLADTTVGSVSQYEFQFGAISDTIQIDFYAQRNPVDGFIWIEITPMETNQLEIQPITPLGPDILSILGSVAIPAIIGVGVIVVVYIVYVKRFKK